MASVPLLSASTKETTNYARLCRLLVDMGSQGLRETFDKIHPPATLHTVLSPHSVHYATLQSLYKGKKKVLNPTQWGKLYPFHSTVTSASFDITLLTVLLRNICGLTPPATGWDSLPPAVDTASIADDIARVKYYRNTVYGHASQASVDDTSFNAYWQEIRDALVRLGGASFRVYIDSLEHDCMDPDVKQHYCALIEQWKKDDDSIKDKLDEMEESIRDSLEQMKHEMENVIRGTVEQMRGEMENNMKELRERLDTLTALAEEKKDKESVVDSLKQMRCEMEHNTKYIKERLETLTAPAEEKRDEGMFRDYLKRMEITTKNISDKLDTLTAPREAKETKNEEMKESLETLTAPVEEKREEGILRDDLKQKNIELLKAGTIKREAKKTKDEDDSERALVLPSGVLEALQLQTCDPSDVVTRLLESLQLEQASLEQPDPDTKRRIRHFCMKAKSTNRLDVVEKLREMTPSGTTGPLLPEALDVRNIPFRQRQNLTIDLSGGDEWKLFAERLGLTPAEIRFVDMRVLNPCDAVLAHSRNQGYITSVGDLYDALVDCDLTWIADLL